MAKLTVTRHGQEVAVLDLQEGQEYIVGRGADCTIVLPEAKGISRQHFKIFQNDDVWMAESLSRFVPLQRDGVTQETIELKKDTVFYAPPYEFQFVMTQEVVAEAPVVDIGSANDQPQAKEDPAATIADTAIRGNLEATVGGIVPLIPFLKIRHPDTDDSEVLKLEGHSWVAGRGSVSEIPLKDARTSRRHFELSRSVAGFYITDLGSSNGTRLNGERLPPHEPTKLESGDIISVLEIELQFEIRDVNMANRLQNLPQLYPYMQIPQPYQHLLPAPPEQAQLPVETVDWKRIKNWTPSNFRKIDMKKFNWKKNWIRVALAVLVPVLLIGALFQNSTPQPRTVASNPNEPVSFDKMTPDQKNAIKDAFNLARSHYMQGKYEMCLTDLATLHQMIPQYEDSKDLEAYCNQGRELVLRQLDNDRREREKAMLEQQIAAIIDGCKEKLKNKGTVDQTRACLAEAIELNPEHPAIAEMIGSAQAREDEDKLLRAQKDAVRKMSKKGEAMYYKAKSFYVNGKLAKSVHQYQRFLEGNYPGLGQVKEAAKREVASVKKELEKKVSTFLDQCKSLNEKNKYKDAYMACDKALAEDPNNDAATTLRSQTLSSLRRDVKGIYEDSVLEESLGNVDSAKEKWKKIMIEDVEFDEYYKRAKILLGKYGDQM